VAEDEKLFIDVKSKKEIKKEKKNLLVRLNSEQLNEIRNERLKSKEMGRQSGNIESFSIDSVDWSDLIRNSKSEEPMQSMFSFTENAVVNIVDQPSESDVEAFHVYSHMARKYADDPKSIDAFSVVTKNIPKSFQDALADSKWGDAARAELQIQADTKCIVAMNQEAAAKAIKEGAKIVILFPIYEEKIKNGILVYKVRLVGNGSHHKINKADTFAPTPSREEMLLLFHLIAHNDWDGDLID